MPSPNFTSILDDSPTEVARPKPLPIGTYLCRVIGVPRYDKSSKKQTDYVEFNLKFLQAEEDVDEEALLECLGDGALTDKVMRQTYYLTEDAAYRLDEFHEHCGLDLDDAISRRQRNEDVINAEVRIVIYHEASQDGTQVYARIRKTMAA